MPTREDGEVGLEVHIHYNKIEVVSKWSKPLASGLTPTTAKLLGWWQWAQQRANALGHEVATKMGGIMFDHCKMVALGNPQSGVDGQATPLGKGVG